MTVKELEQVYKSVDHCIFDFEFSQDKSDVIKLGSNSGRYGWNWTAFLNKKTNTLYLPNYRNVPDSIKEK